MQCYWNKNEISMRSKTKDALRLAQQRKVSQDAPS